MPNREHKPMYSKHRPNVSATVNAKITGIYTSLNFTPATVHSVCRKPALGRESRPRDANTVVLWNAAALVSAAACCRTGAASTRPAEEEPAIPEIRFVATKEIIKGLPS